MFYVVLSIDEKYDMRDTLEMLYFQVVLNTLGKTTDQLRENGDICGTSVLTKKNLFSLRW